METINRRGVYTALDYQQEIDQANAGAGYGHRPSDSNHHADFYDQGDDEGHPMDYPSVPELSSALVPAYSSNDGANFWDLAINGDFVNYVHEMQRHGEFLLRPGANLLKQFPPELVARLTLPIEWRHHATLIGQEGRNIRLISNLTQTSVIFPSLTAQSQLLARGEGHCIETHLLGTIEGLEKCSYLLRAWAPVLVVVPVPEGVHLSFLDPERDDIRAIENVCHVIITLYHPKRISVSAKIGGVADIAGAIFMLAELLDPDARETLLHSARTDLIVPEKFCHILGHELDAAAAATETYIGVYAEDPDAEQLGPEIYDATASSDDEHDVGAYDKRYAPRGASSAKRLIRPAALYDQSSMVNDEKLIRICGRPDDVLKARKLLVDAMPVVLELAVPSDYVFDRAQLVRYGGADKIQVASVLAPAFSRAGETLAFSAKERDLALLLFLGRDVLTTAWSHLFYTDDPTNEHGLVPLSRVLDMEMRQKVAIHQRAERRASRGAGSQHRRRQGFKRGSQQQQQQRQQQLQQQQRQLQEASSNRAAEEVTNPDGVNAVPDAGTRATLDLKQSREERARSLQEKIRECDEYFDSLLNFPDDADDEPSGLKMEQDGGPEERPSLGPIHPSPPRQESASAEEQWPADGAGRQQQQQQAGFQHRRAGDAYSRVQTSHQEQFSRGERYSYHATAQNTGPGIYQNVHGQYGYPPMQSRVTGSFGHWTYPGGGHAPSVGTATAHGAAMMTVPHFGPHGSRGATSAYTSVTATAMHVPGHGSGFLGAIGTEEETVYHRTTVYSYNPYNHHHIHHQQQGMRGQHRYPRDFSRGGYYDGRSRRGNKRRNNRGFQENNGGRRPSQRFLKRQSQDKRNHAGLPTRADHEANQQPSGAAGAEPVVVKVLTRNDQQPSTGGSSTKQGSSPTTGSSVAALKKDLKDTQPSLKKDLALEGPKGQASKQQIEQEMDGRKAEGEDQGSAVAGKSQAKSPHKEGVEKMAHDILESIFVSPPRRMSSTGDRVLIRRPPSRRASVNEPDRNFRVDGGSDAKPGSRGRQRMTNNNNNDNKVKPHDDNTKQQEREEAEHQRDRRPRRTSEATQGATGGKQQQESEPKPALRTTGKTSSCMKPPPAPKNVPNNSRNNNKKREGAAGARPVPHGGQAAVARPGGGASRRNP